MDWVPWMGAILQSHVHKGMQLKGLPLNCTLGPHGWRIQVYVGMGTAGSTLDDQIFKHTDLRHKIKDVSTGFPDSESLGIDGQR